MNATRPTPLAPPATTLDDRALAQRVAAGDGAAFDLLMRRHNRRLYRVARATLRNDAEAQEALQEAYLSAYRGIADFRGDSTLVTWLSRLVLNECFGRLRKSARRQNVMPLLAPAHADEEAATDEEGPEHARARAEMRALLERRLDDLPHDFRLVFVLRAVEELSVEETAECLGIPPATVRSRHFRARGLLRESLARDIDVAEADLFNFDGPRCDGIVEGVKARLRD
jgi:RNA polymerase sigma factor (sigma-70 family)